jgi:endonuclease YncB( thermonuclease family)
MLRSYKIGLVSKVFDADTIAVIYRKKEYILRICSIDAPENDQEFGKEAQQILNSFIFGKRVQFETLNKDKYGRYVSIVKYGNKLIHRWLVSSGLAWVYPYYNKDKSLYSLEKKAKQNKLGLWGYSSPTPPWEYRKTHKK